MKKNCKLKLRFDVEGAAEPATVEANTSQLSEWELAAFADRLVGIDVCRLWNSDEGTMKILDEQMMPIRIVAKRPDLDALREAVREDQAVVESRLARHRFYQLELAEAGVDVPKAIQQTGDSKRTPCAAPTKGAAQSPGVKADDCTSS